MPPPYAPSSCRTADPARRDAEVRLRNQAVVPHLRIQAPVYRARLGDGDTPTGYLAPLRCPGGSGLLVRSPVSGGLLRAACAAPRGADTGTARAAGRALR